MFPTNLKTRTGNTINKLVFDKTGQLWVGTDTDINILNPKTGKLHCKKLSR
jgi:ligand-binding sensor domain-containing protein